jgi:hypothetical protein
MDIAALYEVGNYWRARDRPRCLHTLPVSGSATAALSGTSITWTATGTAMAPGNVSCAASLSGTVEISATQIRVPYTGTTCLGPVSGAEILQVK